MEETKESKEKKPFKERFNTNWNRVDETCPNCGAITKQAKGLTRQNMKKMLRMPSASDWLTLFMIAMVIFLAWSYNHDLQESRYFVKNINLICMQRQEILRQLNESNNNFTLSWINASANNASANIDANATSNLNISQNETINASI